MTTVQRDDVTSALERELDSVLEQALARIIFDSVEIACPVLLELPLPPTDDPSVVDPVEATLADLTSVTTRLTDLTSLTDSVAGIEQIAVLETLIRAASGALAAQEVAFAARQRADQLAAGVRARDLGRGISEQIAFARRVSPTSASRHLGYAQSLQSRLPETYRELRAGRVSEAQARIAVTRSSHLSDIDAGILDAAVAQRMSGWNAGATEKAVDHAAYAIDPHGSVDRRSCAEKDRRVWVRPAPDSMAIVSALLPMAQGVAVYANLRAAAQTLQGTGEAAGRGLGQVMADLLVTRCTGQHAAAAVAMELRVTMPLDSLLGTANQPAWVENYGPVPAPLVRELCGDAESSADPASDRAADRAGEAQVDRRVWILRLFTDPVHATVAAVDNRRRLFPENLRRHIFIRDRECRQPFCSSPIREIDHVLAHASGGRTTLANGQGLCLRGNKMKELPGWSTQRRQDGSTVLTTPTGHRYIREPQAAAGFPAVTRRE